MRVIPWKIKFQKNTSQLFPRYGGYSAAGAYLLRSTWLFPYHGGYSWLASNEDYFPLVVSLLQGLFQKIIFYCKEL